MYICQYTPSKNWTIDLTWNRLAIDSPIEFFTIKFNVLYLESTITRIFRSTYKLWLNFEHTELKYAYWYLLLFCCYFAKIKMKVVVYFIVTRLILLERSRTLVNLHTELGRFLPEIKVLFIHILRVNILLSATRCQFAKDNSLRDNAIQRRVMSKSKFWENRL